MTRVDLEETIACLEYLSAMKTPHSDTREEYEQQLQTFRVALQAINQQRDTLASAKGRKFDWDTRLGLMYAEQELFLMVKALTARESLGVGHQHLRWLLQQERHLPTGLVDCLRGLDAAFARREETRAKDEAGAFALTTATMAALDAVRVMLGERRRDVA